MKFSKAIFGYSIYMQAGGFSSATISNNLGCMNRLMKFIGDLEITEITIVELREYMIHLKSRNLSECTRQNHYKIIRAFFHWAELELKLPRPDTQLSKPQFTPKVIQPYTEEEVKKLLKSCQTMNPAKTKNRKSFIMKRSEANRDRLLILLLLDTGMRISEACRIQYKDINLGNRSIHVCSFETGGKSRDRIVYFGARSLKLLWKLFTDEPEPNKYLFVSRTGRPLNRDSAKSMIQELGKRAKIEGVSCHRFRHTFAIQYLRNGGDIYTLKMLLGHNSLFMVERYLQLSQADAEKAHRKASPVDNWYL